MTATASLGGLTGVVGGRWRARVTGHGAIITADRTLDWYVAAEDRWHRAAAEATLRQRRIAGTAVYETRLRVPGGDVVQLIWSVADAGGITLIELTNESPRAVAVALDRGEVLTVRPPPAVPVEGIDLPRGAIVLPVGHRASVVVGIAHDGWRAGRLPARLPTADEVVNGWLAVTATASRLDVPDDTLADGVVLERCELLLAGPPPVASDPVATALAIVELVRMGDPADEWVPELVAAVEAIARESGWDVDAAIERAGIVLAAAGDDRALADLGRLASRRARAAAASVLEQPTGIRLVAWAERQFAVPVRGGDGGATAELLPRGFPPGWLGEDFEVFTVPTAPASTVSFAVRWHGEHPAVLWEQHGPAVVLRAASIDPRWTTEYVRGEALWRMRDRLPT